MANCIAGVPFTNWSGHITGTPALTCTPSSLSEIEAIVRNAESNSQRVHAVGSRWSFSDAPSTNGVNIETWKMSSMHFWRTADGGGGGKSVLHADALKNRYGLALVEAGTKISVINKRFSVAKMALSLLLLGMQKEGSEFFRKPGASQ